MIVMWLVRFLTGLTMPRERAQYRLRAGPAVTVAPFHQQVVGRQLGVILGVRDGRADRLLDLPSRLAFAEFHNPKRVGHRLPLNRPGHIPGLTRRDAHILRYRLHVHIQCSYSRDPVIRIARSWACG